MLVDLYRQSVAEVAKYAKLDHIKAMDEKLQCEAYVVGSARNRGDDYAPA